MPSAKILDLKKAEVASLVESFRSAQTLVVADYRGITVEEDTALRAELRKAGVTYKIVKNTLASRAAKELGFEGLEEVFKGPTAIAYSSDDVVAPARILKEFEKKVETFTVKGGVMEGQVASLEELTALSQVPSRDILLSKLVGGLISPIAGLAMILNSIHTKAEEAGASTVAEVVAEKTETVSEEATTPVEEVAPSETKVEEATEVAETKE